MELMGVAKIHGAAFHPQSQGLVERQNQTIVTIVRIMAEKQEDWIKHIAAAEMAYNGTRHETTGETPHLLWYGRERATPLGLMYEAYHAGEKHRYPDYIRDYVLNLAKAHEIARNNTQQAQARQARQHDKRVKNSAPLQVGELVMTFVQARRHHCRKLQNRYHGPWRIIKVYGNGHDYLLNNGMKVNHEFIRPFIHKLHNHWLDDNGEYKYRYYNTGDPILEVDPGEYIGLEEGPDPSEDGDSTEVEDSDLRGDTPDRRNRQPVVENKIANTNEENWYEPREEPDNNDSQDEEPDPPPASYLQQQEQRNQRNTVLEFPENDDEDDYEDDDEDDDEDDRRGKSKKGKKRGDDDNEDD